MFSLQSAELSLTNVLVLSGVASTLALLALAVYRLTLHPLSRFPGPVLAKLTDWYMVFFIWKGNNHVNLYHLHQKYGKIVRHGPNRLSINDPKAIKEIYGSYGQTAKILKADYYTVVGHHFGELNINSEADPEKHNRKRRIISQGLNESAVKTMEPHFQKNAELLCNLVRPKEAGTWSEPVDIDKLGNQISFDVMTDSIFGRSFNMLTSRTNRWILNVLPDAVKFLHTVGHMPGLLKLDCLPFKPQMAKDMDMYKELSEDIAYQRANRGKQPSDQPKDIFSYLEDARDPETGEGMNKDELVAEAGVLVIAGSDATALAMTATMYQLARQPAIQERVRAEVASHFSSPSEICLGSELSACKYLRACIDESMRLTPAIGGVYPRKVLEPGVVISDTFIPAGTVVGVPTYSIHRDEVSFPEPLTYNPDRWVKEDKQGKTPPELLRARRAFNGFSTGPRECVGRLFGYAEVSLVIAKVVSNFELQFDRLVSDSSVSVSDYQSHAEDLPTKDKFLSHPVEGPFIRFRSR